MNNTPALAPCPFCGSPPKIKTRATVMVSCTSCTACTFQSLDDKESAIKDWNRRAPATPAQGDELPPLPALPTKEYEYTSPKTGWFTASQMQKYAREYGAACRASAGAAENAKGCGKCPRSTPYGPGICATCLQAGAADALDAARLDFMAQHEAWIAFGKDGESCRVFHHNEDGDAVPMLGWGARHWRHDIREAIDAARNTQPGGAA